VLCIKTRVRDFSVCCACLLNNISNADQHVLESSISDSNSISVYDGKKALVDSTLIFVSKLYASNTLNRAYVQEIVDAASELLSLSLSLSMDI